jgi:hypothetical protein
MKIILYLTIIFFFSFQLGSGFKVWFILSDQNSFYTMTIPIMKELISRGNQVKVFAPKEKVNKTK